MQLFDYAFAALVGMGHMAICIALVNRLHSSSLSYHLLRWLKWALYFVGAIPVVVVPKILTGIDPVDYRSIVSTFSPGFLYAVLCCVAGFYTISVWCRRKFLLGRYAPLRSNYTERLQLGQKLGQRALGTPFPHFIAQIPGNQILSVEANEKVLKLPRLPEQLDGLTIAHLSDLHLSGKLSQRFFEEIVHHVNKWDADLVAVTGDLVDRPHCIEWLPHILGQLRARYGVISILGNHDARLRDIGILQKELTNCGMVQLGGIWKSLQIEGHEVVVAGNQLPWLLSAPKMEDAPPGRTEDGALRVLLSHSPDQIRWATQRDFDLMLAGHTHGGQIRLPVIGPVVCPSRYGVKYASGVFYRNPVIMHVSRGISGSTPLRINCPPEITKLVLTRV